MGTTEVEMKDLPYTVVGHTGIPHPVLSILLTGKGIKEIAKRIEDEDMVRITEWSDFSNKGQERKHYGEISVVKAK